MPSCELGLGIDVFIPTSHRKIVSLDDLDSKILKLMEARKQRPRITASIPMLRKGDEKKVGFHTLYIGNPGVDGKEYFDNNWYKIMGEIAKILELKVHSLYSFGDVLGYQCVGQDVADPDVGQDVVAKKPILKECGGCTYYQ